MKKFLFLLPFLFIAAKIEAQPPAIVFVSTTPTGSCSSRATPRILTSTGVIYTCGNGVWVGAGASTPSGTTLPAACSVGGVYSLTTGATGFYQCTSPNNWTLIGPPTTAQDNIGNHLLSGCGVEYVSGLSFTVGACSYTIGGTTFTSALTNITLTAADMTNPRIDVLIVDNTGVATKITGTAATPPAEPSIDPSTQLALIFVTVAATATTPSGIVNTPLYLENTEWTCTPTAHINCASTSNPYQGTKDIEATAAVLNNNFTLVKPAAGTIDLSTQANLIFYIRSKGQWPTANNTGASGLRTLSLFWLNGSTQVGAAIVLRDGVFGFSSSITTGYQQITVPIGLFGTGTNLVTTLKFNVSGNGGTSSFGWYIDDVTLQSGSLGSSSNAVGFGPYSGLPTTCSPGDTYRTSDSPYTFQCTAVNTQTPFYYGWKTSLPPASNTISWLNQNSSTYVTTSGYGTLTTIQQNGSGGSMIYFAAPATPYTLVARMSFAIPNVNFENGGLALYASSSGRFITIGPTAGNMVIRGGKWTATNNLAANTDSVFNLGTKEYCYAVEYDGTNVKAGVSIDDCLHFAWIFNETVGTFFTLGQLPDKVGLFWDKNNTTNTTDEVTIWTWEFRGAL